MNDVLDSEQSVTLLKGPHLIAQIALGRLRDVSVGVNRSVTYLFLHDPFALGYAIGFAEQSCQCAKTENEEANCAAYVLEVISHMLGDDAVAASFVSYAASKKGDRRGEGGYDAGSGDLDAWYTSGAGYIPSGLLQYPGMDRTGNDARRSRKS